MRKRCKYIIGFVSLFVLGGLLIFVKSNMSNDFIKYVEIGHTTYEDVMAADPDAVAIVTSYGYTTFHDLADGRKASIKFVYDNDVFIATSITIASDYNDITRGRFKGDEDERIHDKSRR